MAKLITKKYQNNNSKSSAFGKTYARIIHLETLSTNEFASHIHSHGSPFDRATINGVLMAACDCLVELVKESKKVQLGDLGTFYLSAESEGADSAGEYTANKVKKVHLRFLPNMKKEYPLDSVSMRKVASFRDIDDLIKGTSKSEGASQGGGENTGSESGVPIDEMP